MIHLTRAAKAAAFALLLSACKGDAEAQCAGPKAQRPCPGQTLTFQDEFDSLDLRRDGVGAWTPHFHMDGPNDVGSRTLPTNKELQIYVDPAFAGVGTEPLGLNPFRIRDGKLIIRAERASPEVSARIWNFPYTSGLLTTFDSFSQTYGYFEIRARLPRGKGLWPAFWLLPKSREWPPEIDVFEALGQDPDLIHQTVHWSYKGEHELEHEETRIDGAADDFHTYGVEWTKTDITWFIDGRRTGHTPTPDDLHQPAYLLVNLAVGGWAGEPDASAFPAEMEIDYVRAYGAAPKKP